MTAPANVASPVVRPVAAPALYRTRIRHVRSSPVRHEFAYRGHWWLVDLDDLPTLPSLLARFEARDHCGDPNRSLRSNVEAYLAEHGIDLAGGQIVLLTGARSFGHVFNPLSVYWCHDRAGRVRCAIAEVHNTYGGRHRYLLRLDERGQARTDKQFYVSPFFDVSGAYRLSLPVPTRHLRISITLHRAGERPFVATVRGRQVPITLTAALRAATVHGSARTAALIRRQGIALWARGLRVQPRPNRPEGTSRGPDPR